MEELPKENKKSSAANTQESVKVLIESQKAPISPKEPEKKEEFIK